MSEWNALLDQVEGTKRSPLRPQMVIRALSDLLPDDAVISLDCGANTHFAARCLKLRTNQSLTGTGMLASVAPGLSYGIAAKYAFPDRPSIVITGDGGFSMLMAELVTATSNKLPVKIILLKNNSLAGSEVRTGRHRKPQIRLRAGTHRFRGLCQSLRRGGLPLRASGGSRACNQECT